MRPTARRVPVSTWAAAARPTSSASVTMSAQKPPRFWNASPPASLRCAIPDSTPLHLDEYTHLLAAEAPIAHCTSGLTWCFPAALSYAHDVPLIASGTLAGDRLLARLAHQGLPQALLDLGFTSLDDFWPPWSAALQNGEIASIAFAARLSPAAAETGAVTVQEFRGLGLAAAATAGWAAHPALRGRVLF